MNVKRAVASLVILFVLQIAGCSGSASDSPDSAAVWRLDDSLWIGSADGMGPEVFGSIVAMAVDAAGTIYVFDGQARELRSFGSDGSFISRFGRRGAGPGEFEHVVGMSVAADTAVWLVDGANARYTVVRSALVASYPRPSSVYNVPWLGGHVEGSLHDAVVFQAAGRGEALVRVDGNGVVSDTFSLPQSQIEAPRIGSITLPLPFASKEIRAFDSRGAFWTASSHEYALHQISFAGDTLRTIRREVEPRRLTTTEMDSVRQYVRALQGEFGLDIRDQLIPQTAPLLKQLMVADDGYVWATRADPPIESPAGTELDILDPDGQLAGTVHLDLDLVIHAVKDGHLYGVATDELGVQRVYRARITQSAEPL